jgi:hypothetical protein
MTTAEGLILIVAGVIGLLISRQLTVNALKKSGLANSPLEVQRAMQDTRIVPKYVSIIYIASWLMVAVGMMTISPNLMNILSKLVSSQ